MKSPQYSPRKCLRANVLLYVILFALSSAFVQATEVGSSEKHNSSKNLKQINNKTKLKPRVSNNFTRVGKNTKSCQKAGRNNSSINSFSANTRPKACSSVNDCNDLIADCISAGGEFYPDKHDPNTGAPSSGTCVTSGC